MNTNSALIVPSQPDAAPAPPANLAFQDTAKPLIDIPDAWLWVIWIASTLVVLTLIYFLWRYLRKKSELAKIAPIIPPHIRARRALEEALTLISEPKPFSIRVSDTLRIYLEERFSFHAPDRTTEEFLYELQSTKLLTAEQKQSLAEFLTHCDLIKFAKYEPMEVELRTLHTSAMRLVNETEPRLISTEIHSTVTETAPVVEPVVEQPPAASEKSEIVNPISKIDK